MKYGWRERISGAIILVALGAIFLPMLFDDPEPRQQGPEPVMVIEQPVDGGETRQRIIESPEPPASVAGNASGGSDSESDNAVPEPDTRDQLSGGSADSFGGTDASASDSNQAPPADSESVDPIADLAQSSQGQSNQSSDRAQARQPEPEPEPAPAQSERTPASSDGGWVVQVGSFGQPDNAKRLTADLKQQGFAAYSQPRDNNLTTVYVGPFDSSEAGEKARAELKQAANIQGLLIRKPGS
ncbi:SPOR domain-containing protein [Salinicola peritrichatus]|uniref:SPOR domain-containing protein n=1 Tax=Salinicola peritrichatus TaxID=1267424 RepID=UPI000DA132A8|nr:SPOR domain-containing protein [Salinicola peritrichatus]